MDVGGGTEKLRYVGWNSQWRQPDRRTTGTIGELDELT